MSDGNESDSERNISHKSDSSYVPSNDELESDGNSPKKTREKKGNKKKRPAKNKIASHQASQLKKQKIDRPLIKNKNYNEFFENVIVLPQKSSEPSPENGETIILEDEPSGCVVVEEDLLQSMRDEIREQRHEIHGLQRQLARIEALIKFQKESTGDSTDGHKENDSCMDILQSYGLPITSIEKLDEIEQNLKAVDFKFKLVRQ